MHWQKLFIAYELPSALFLFVKLLLHSTMGRNSSGRNNVLRDNIGPLVLQLSGIFYDYEIRHSLPSYEVVEYSPSAVGWYDCGDRWE